MYAFLILKFEILTNLCGKCFRLLRKIAESDYNFRYVYLSVRMEQLGSYGMNRRKF
jgi:hypothetical protein